MPHEDPNSNSVGDNHLWEVWHGLKPLRFYREQYPRFASEFGMQSLPALSTIATYAEPADWNMTSYVMEHHQRHMYGNGKIIAYLTQHYLLAQRLSVVGVRDASAAGRSDAHGRGTLAAQPRAMQRRAVLAAQ